jgi:cell division protease FtsH
VKKLIDASYEKAKTILTQHMAEFTQLAELLLEREVIFSEDLEKIFGKREYASPHELLN